MQNLNLIRKHGPTGFTLAISLLCALSGTSQASLGSKPFFTHSSSHRQEKTKEAGNEAPKRKIFASLFSKNRSSTGHSRSSTVAHGIRTVRTTAYTHEEADHQAYGRSNAIGTTLQCSRNYTSAAADWSRFPLGTKFQIVGEPTVYVIDDCGGALYGTNTIDIYRPNMASMNAWGTRHVQIKILEWATRRSNNHRS
jgi:3D (Asp-Asp-Asp) domain-containing protein